MPLIDVNGLARDIWRVIGEDEALPDKGAVILSLARLRGGVDPGLGDRPLGVYIPNTVGFDEVSGLGRRLDLIAIDFPAFSDGRGFSLARSFRMAGFAGELRAVGPLIADQFAFAWACGFDTIHIPDALASRQPAEQWRTALGAMSQTYQRGYRTRADILSARHGR
jgi:uncharacterized protein (DUF934 family)